MKVGMYYNNSDVRVEHMPVPEVGDKDILIKVMSSGICGSDIMEWYRIKRAPLVLGHELTGEIVETGKNVTGFKKGDRVFSTHHVPCDKCYYCITGHQTACEVFQTKNNFFPGGFAEFLKVSGESISKGTFILPDSMSFEEGSFTEPLGTAVRGLITAGIKPGDSLLVLGSGIVGLLIVKLARILGAGHIITTDINDFRLDAAAGFGAEHTVRAENNVPEYIKEVNSGRLADKVMVCAGSRSASLQALESVERGGTVVFFAVPRPEEKVEVDFNYFWRKDITLKTCYGAAPSDNIRALELIRAGSIDVTDMVTHRYGIDEIGEGFRKASTGGDCLKVIIEPNR